MQPLVICLGLDVYEGNRLVSSTWQDVPSDCEGVEGDYEGDDDFDITKDMWIIAYAGNKRLTERCYASEDAARFVWDAGPFKVIDELGVEGVEGLDNLTLTDYDWNIKEFYHFSEGAWRG